MQGSLNFNPMLIRSFALNYLKRILRSPFGTWVFGGNLLAFVCFWIPAFFYTFYVGFSVVEYLDIHYSIDLLTGVNSMILPFLVMCSLADGLLLRRKIYMSLLPYLIIPIPRRTLAVLNQIVMIFGKFNIFVLVFMIGFWVRNFYLQDIIFSWNWLLTLCLLFACIHAATNILRCWSGESYFVVLGVLFCFLVLTIFEWVYNIGILSEISNKIFNGAIGGILWPPLLMAGLAVFLFQWSNMIIKQNLYVDHSLNYKFKKIKKIKIFYKKNHRNFSSEMLFCEWNLIFRNRQPRSYLFMIIIVIIFYTIINSGISIEMGTKNLQEIPIMFSILLPTIYFSISFDFRSSFYDKLQSTPVSTKMILKTIISISHRWTLLVCVVVMIVSTLSSILYNFYIFPKSIFMIGIILYGMGIINLAALLLNILFPVPRKVNAGLFQSAIFGQLSIINPQIISLFIFPIIFCGIPIVVIKFIFNLSLSNFWIGLSMSIIGLLGLCIQSWLITFFVIILDKKKYYIMNQFRINS